MFGHLPAISPRAIRTGSWLALEAATRARRPWLSAAACSLFAGLSLSPVAHAARPHVPYPAVEWPLEIPGGQYAPMAWKDIAGWNEDDHLEAFKAFRASCKPIVARRQPPAD